jgi:hypothetical protein
VGEQLPAGPRTVLVEQYGALAVVVEPKKGSVDVALVLDDRDSILDAAHTNAWRLWLQLSNALALRDWPTVITTTSLVSTQPATVRQTEPAVTEGLPDGVDEKWAAAYESAAPGAERELILLLAAHAGLEAPLVGAEGPQGIPMDLSWPRLHVAVALYDMPDEDRDDLGAAGWHVVKPDPEAIVAALSGHANNAGTTERGEL